MSRKSENFAGILQYHLTEIFHRNFRANGKRSLCRGGGSENGQWRQSSNKQKIFHTIENLKRSCKNHWTSEKRKPPNLDPVYKGPAKFLKGQTLARIRASLTRELRNRTSFWTANNRAIFVWSWHEKARTKQKQQTNGNRAIWSVYRTDTNALGYWLVKRTLGWKNFMPENFLEINRYFALTSYCNKNGQSNNAFSILGFFFWRENEGAMSWSFHPLADKTNNEHLPKPFFRVIRKSLYMYCNL